MFVKRKWRTRVFISYAGKDGYTLAIKTKEILKKHNYNPWLYNHNRVVGALSWDDISYTIKRKTDIFLYLCTPNSPISRGQAFESEYAMQTDRLMPEIICIDKSIIPYKLSIFNPDYFDSKDFEHQFDLFAPKIKSVLLCTKFLPRAKRAKRITRVSK